MRTVGSDSGPRENGGAHDKNPLPRDRHRHRHRLPLLPRGQTRELVTNAASMVYEEIMPAQGSRVSRGNTPTRGESDPPRQDIYASDDRPIKRKEVRLSLHPPQQGVQSRSSLVGHVRSHMERKSFLPTPADRPYRVLL